MKTKIYVSGKYIQRNNKSRNKKRKKDNIVERKRVKKRGLLKEEVILKERDLGMVLSIERGKESDEAHEAHIVDSNGNIVVKVVYDPSIPRGAKIWIETELEVRSIINKY